MRSVACFILGRTTQVEPIHSFMGTRGIRWRRAAAPTAHLNWRGGGAYTRLGGGSQVRVRLARCRQESVVPEVPTRAVDFVGAAFAAVDRASHWPHATVLRTSRVPMPLVRARCRGRKKGAASGLAAAFLLLPAGRHSFEPDLTIHTLSLALLGALSIAVF